MPPPILPENMVQECDSQTGRCWFTTKPEVAPVIGTSASVITIEPQGQDNANMEPATKPDTQGWSSGQSVPTQKVEPAFEPVAKPAEPMPPANAATGGWSSDTAAVIKPVQRKVNVVVNPPATQGWSSSTVVPNNKPKSKAVPSTAGHIHDSAPRQQPIIPAIAPTVTPSSPPSAPVPQMTVPATGGWSSGMRPSTTVNTNVAPASTNVAVLPPATNIAINQPIDVTHSSSSPPGTGAWSSAHSHH